MSIWKMYGYRVSHAMYLRVPDSDMPQSRPDSSMVRSSSDEALSARVDEHLKKMGFARK